MSVFDITEEKDAPITRGTGFWIDGFGQVSIEWIEPEIFDTEYDKLMVVKAFIKAAERLFETIEIISEDLNTKK